MNPKDKVYKVYNQLDKDPLGIKRGLISGSVDVLALQVRGTDGKVLTLAFNPKEVEEIANAGAEFLHDVEQEKLAKSKDKIRLYYCPRCGKYKPLDMFGTFNDKRGELCSSCEFDIVICSISPFVI